MNWKSDVEELKLRNKLAKSQGGTEAIKLQHAKGRLTLRERIDLLLDKSSFDEVGKIAGDAEKDDSGKFLNDYIENKIFDVDPFVSIDEGVGDLIEIATLKGKKQNKKIKFGICGEHGGDPKSINFCSKTGLNYVSCSPYRVPVARLAAAQAELKK